MFRNFLTLFFAAALTTGAYALPALAESHEGSGHEGHEEHPPAEKPEEDAKAETEGGANANKVLVYKSPTCGCCTKWERHLERNGFSVTSVKRTDMDTVKNEARIPRGMRACHTAMVDGYVIEGHVPAADIKRLLEERPAIMGLAVPGMPMGSPGMEAAHSEPYDVLALRADGEHDVFASHPSSGNP